MKKLFCIPFDSQRIDIETINPLLSQQFQKSVLIFYKQGISEKMGESPNESVAWRIVEKNRNYPISPEFIEKTGQSMIMHGIPGRTDIHLVYGKFVDSPPWTYILSGVTRNLIAFNREARAIDVYPMGTEGAGAELATSLMIDIHLLLREICTRYLLDKGWGMMHGGAVALRGKGIAVLGERRAGKTSLLTNLMLHKNATYITNDRLLFSKQGETFYLRGWPSSMRMGIGTLFQYEQLRPRIPAKWRKIEEFTSEELWSIDEKVSLHGNEILETFGVTNVSKSTLDIVFLPRFSSEFARTVIRRASSADLRDLLDPEIFLVPDLEHPDWLSLSMLPLQESITHTRKLAHELITEIPFYVFESGGDPTEMNQVLTQFLSND